jgi:hypothetical protein
MELRRRSKLDPPLNWMGNPLSAKWARSWRATMVFFSMTGFWHPISDALLKIIRGSKHSGEIKAFHLNRLTRTFSTTPL